MGADFDGDEMQLYFLTCIANNAEIALLMGMQRQLITYESGKNLIGGCPDLECGMFYIQQFEEFKAGIRRIVKQYFGDLNYGGPDGIVKDTGIHIVNGEAIRFDTSICDVNSKFITFV